jgi:hypothetical protein
MYIPEGFEKWYPSNVVLLLTKTLYGLKQAAMQFWKLQPIGVWDGGNNFEFTINGKSDSDYAKDATRRSVNGWAVWLNDAPINFRSNMMPIVALSVMEAELFAAVLCAHDMLFAMRILQNIGWKVKLPMKGKMDNKGAVDFNHNYSVGGRTRHIELKQYFLRECKRQD